MKDWKERFRQRMAVLKERDGLTQQELATKIGRSQTLISKWLLGEREPGIEDLEKIAAALGVTTEWLMHGIGAPDPVTNEILERLAQMSEAEREAFLLLIRRSS